MKFYEVKSDRGISIDADSESPTCVLWCCGGICHQLLTFFQIGCGHTVNYFLNGMSFRSWTKNNFSKGSWRSTLFTCNAQISRTGKQFNLVDILIILSNKTDLPINKQFIPWTVPVYIYYVPLKLTSIGNFLQLLQTEVW